MIKSLYTLILAALMFCCGCATLDNYEWVKPDATAQQIFQDKDECRGVAQFSNMRPNQVGGMLSGTDTGRVSDDFDNCMIRKGYTKQYKH